MEILYTDDAGRLQVFAPDATIRENHRLSAVVTSHPVEEGADMANHIRPESTPLVVEFEVTNHPIEAPLGILGSHVNVQIARTYNEYRAMVQARFKPGITLQFGPAQLNVNGEPLDIKPASRREVSENVSARVLQFATPFDRLQSTFDLLDRIRTRGLTVSVYTSLRTYENMAISNVSAPREPAESILFSVEFTPIKNGSVKLVAVAPIVAEKRAEKKVATGAQQQYTLPEEQQSIADGALQSLAQALVR